jgi:hypothetical protein
MQSLCELTKDLHMVEDVIAALEGQVCMRHFALGSGAIHES